MSNALLERKAEFRPSAAVELTDAQRQVLAFLRSYVAENDNMPTAKTVSEQFGWTSPNAGYDVLVRLEKKGHIERLAGQVGWRFVRATTGAGTACR